MIELHDERVVIEERGLLEFLTPIGLLIFLNVKASDITSVRKHYGQWL